MTARLATQCFEGLHEDGSLAYLYFQLPARYLSLGHAAMTRFGDAIITILARARLSIAHACIAL